MTHLILIVLALVCFLVAAVNLPGTPGRPNWTALGLAFWVLSVIINGR